MMIARTIVSIIDSEPLLALSILNHLTAISGIFCCMMHFEIQTKFFSFVQCSLDVPLAVEALLVAITISIMIRTKGKLRFFRRMFRQDAACIPNISFKAYNIIFFIQHVLSAWFKLLTSLEVSGFPILQAFWECFGHASC